MGVQWRRTISKLQQAFLLLKVTDGFSQYDPVRVPTTSAFSCWRYPICRMLSDHAAGHTDQIVTAEADVGYCMSVYEKVLLHTRRILYRAHYLHKQGSRLVAEFTPLRMDTLSVASRTARLAEVPCITTTQTSFSKPSFNEASSLSSLDALCRFKNRADHGLLGFALKAMRLVCSCKTLVRRIWAIPGQSGGAILRDQGLWRDTFVAFASTSRKEQSAMQDRKSKRQLGW